MTHQNTTTEIQRIFSRPKVKNADLTPPHHTHNSQPKRQHTFTFHTTHTAAIILIIIIIIESDSITLSVTPCAFHVLLIPTTNSSMCHAIKLNQNDTVYTRHQKQSTLKKKKLANSVKKSKFIKKSSQISQIAHQNIDSVQFTTKSSSELFRELSR